MVDKPIRLINCTGRPCYCEDCGARIEPGKSHVCPGPEPETEPEEPNAGN